MTSQNPRAIRHRTSLDVGSRRFEQFCDGVIVASASFEERDGVIVITGVRRHSSDRRHSPDLHGSETAPIDRLATGLLEIARQSGRTVDIDRSLLSTGDEPSSCSLTRDFAALWSSGSDHRAAAEMARANGVGRLALIKALHSLWEMPLTADAAALAFGENGRPELEAMFHTLNWIIDHNPTATMSELQAFDDATGLSVKTHALSVAGRARDTIAIVDRMEPDLHLRPIDEPTARRLASSTIREEDGRLRVQDRSTVRHAFGWLFLYQSAEYLETGDYSTMISGNAPLLVDRFTGAIWPTGTEHRPSVYLDNYSVTGNPLRGVDPGYGAPARQALA